jgi:hypothetical protein
VPESIPVNNNNMIIIKNIFIIFNFKIIYYINIIQYNISYYQISNIKPLINAA